MAEVKQEKRAARRFPLRVPVSVSRNSNGSSETAQIRRQSQGMHAGELRADAVPHRPRHELTNQFHRGT